MKKFVVIGETCEDVFIYGKVKRLSPEAPVPVFIPINTVTNQGMAGNVCNNIVSISKKYTNKDIIIYSLVSINENVKTRYVDEKSNHYFMRVDEGDESHNKIKLTKPDLKKIALADVIVISDYNKGFITENDIELINSYRNQINSLLLIDSKKLITKKLLKIVDFFKMNESEYQANLNNLGIDVIKKYSNKIIITKGERGATYNDKDYIGNNHKSSDVSGAGDTFFAALSVTLAFNFPIEESICLANKYASEVVIKRGVSTI